jgi:hypothetical protein
VVELNLLPLVLMAALFVEKPVHESL